jgi:soluble lytic murein transglycosylase-like protein
MSLPQAHYGRSIPDLAVWIRTWSPEENPATPGFELERARMLFRCGFIQHAAAELKEALVEAGSSLFMVADILETALIQENYRVSATAATRLAEEFEAETDLPSPLWLNRLKYPIPYSRALGEQGGLLGIDYRLLAALIRKESYYTRTAVSRANAIGLMQLLPATARQTAVFFPNLNPERLTEVGTNIQLGAYYLSDLLAANDGNQVFALAGYNAGPHNTKRWREQLRSDDPELWIETITYGETRDYIKTVLAFWWRYSQLWPREPRTLAEILDLKPDLLEKSTGEDADYPQ